MARNTGLWADVKRSLDAAERCWSRAAPRAASLAAHGDEMPDDVRADRELAVGKHLHDFYGALEQAIERIVAAVDGDLPMARNYHEELVRRAATEVPGIRGPIISTELAADLQALRAFHHVYNKAYGEFDYARAEPNVIVARRTLPRFKDEVTAFAQAFGIKGEDSP